MDIMKKLLGSTILAASLTFAGCSTISLPQDVKETVVPESYSMISNKIEGSDSENEMTLVFENAELVQNASDDLVITFSGRFYHNNPKIKTDSPFVGMAKVGLVHHGSGIVSVKNATPMGLSLFSVHTPVKSLVDREANEIFGKAVREMEGKYLKQQQMLRIQHNLETLFN